MVHYFPIALELKNKKVVIAGGGQVAQRKLISLLAAGANVRVVSPSLTAELSVMARLKKITWRKRAVRCADFSGAFLVVAATDSSAVNEKVSRWAKRAGAMVNVVDKPALSDFISPAVFTARDAFVAVYTDGKNPPLSRDLKNYIKERWDDFISYRNRS